MWGIVWLAFGTQKEHQKPPRPGVKSVVGGYSVLKSARNLTPGSPVNYL